MELIESATWASAHCYGVNSILHVSFTPYALPLRGLFSKQLMRELERAFPTTTFELAFGDETEFAIKAEPGVISFKAVAKILEDVASSLGVALYWAAGIHTTRMLKTLLHWLGLPYADDILSANGIPCTDDPNP